MKDSLTAKLKKVGVAFVSSYVCLAFAALVLLDLGTRITFSVWPIDHYNSPNRSWVWWAAKDFREHSKNPNIVLMGSSLMMAALHNGDATYLKIPQNVAYHHRSTYLEALLTDKTKSPITTFAFAIGGQMVSDAYVISSTLLRGEGKPQTLVYGIAPRDFMDNMLTSPASTETFRYMNRIGDLSDVAMPARTTFWEKTEWAVDQVSFLYSHRLDFVYLQNKYSRNILTAFGAKDLDSVKAPFLLRKIAMHELPEDNGPNELMINPYDPTQPFVDNSAEYKLRYKSFKKKLFEMQLSFLKRLGGYCKESGINLVLVNMPLTSDNVQLMPEGFYDYYLNNVKATARDFGASVVDLNQPRIFTKECFADSVHLNGHGGKRFFEVLSDSLAKDSRVAVSRQTKIH